MAVNRGQPAAIAATAFDHYKHHAAEAMSAPSIRDCWNAMATWSRDQAANEAQGFTNRQPEVSAFVLAYLEDDGQDAAGLGLQVALAIDEYYRQMLGRPPSHVELRMMEEALADAEQGLEQLIGVEPTLALRRSLFERDMAAPEVLVDLIEPIMEEAEGDPDLGPAAGGLFVTAKAIALAYERANGIGGPKSSLSDAIEAKIGRPLANVSRNDPCPCGSGRKFKKCCAVA